MNDRITPVFKRPGTATISHEQSEQTRRDLEDLSHSYTLAFYCCALYLSGQSPQGTAKFADMASCVGQVLPEEHSLNTGTYNFYQSLSTNGLFSSLLTIENPSASSNSYQVTPNQTRISAAPLAGALAGLFSSMPLVGLNDLVGAVGNAARNEWTTYENIELLRNLISVEYGSAISPSEHLRGEELRLATAQANVLGRLGEQGLLIRVPSGNIRDADRYPQYRFTDKHLAIRPHVRKGLYSENGTDSLVRALYRYHMDDKWMPLAKQVNPINVINSRRLGQFLTTGQRRAGLLLAYVKLVEAGVLELVKDDDFKHNLVALNTAGLSLIKEFVDIHDAASSEDDQDWIALAQHGMRCTNLVLGQAHRGETENLRRLVASSRSKTSYARSSSD